MLTFHWRTVAPDATDELPPSVAATNPDLRIRNLLDDQRLSDALADLGPDRPAVTRLPYRIPGVSLSATLRAAIRDADG